MENFLGVSHHFISLTVFLNCFYFVTETLWSIKKKKKKILSLQDWLEARMCITSPWPDSCLLDKAKAPCSMAWIPGQHTVTFAKGIFYYSNRLPGNTWYVAGKKAKDFCLCKSVHKATKGTTVSRDRETTSSTKYWYVITHRHIQWIVIDRSGDNSEIQKLEQLSRDLEIK